MAARRGELSLWGEGLPSENVCRQRSGRRGKEGALKLAESKAEVSIGLNAALKLQARVLWTESQQSIGYLGKGGTLGQITRGGRGEKGG